MGIGRGEKEKSGHQNYVFLVSIHLFHNKGMFSVFILFAVVSTWRIACEVLRIDPTSCWKVRLTNQYAFFLPSFPLSSPFPSRSLPHFPCLPSLSPISFCLFLFSLSLSISLSPPFLQQTLGILPWCTQRNVPMQKYLKRKVANPFIL